MRYLDVLQEQLVAASHERSHSQGPAATAHPPARRRITSRRLALSVVSGLLGLAVVSGAIAEATGIVRLPSPWDLTAPSPYGQAQSISPQLASAFRVLRRPRVASDAMTNAAASTIGSEPTGPGSHNGTNPRLARRITMPDGTQMYLEPGSLGTCLVFAGGGGSCGSNQIAEAHGLFVGLVPTHGGASSLEGVVPDGATVTATARNGTTHAIRLGVDNTLSLSSATTASIVIRTPNNAPYHLPLPGLTP